MLIGGYKIRNQSVSHFISFATVEWIDVFTRQVYCDMLLDSLRHCQIKKGLLVHSWCIMSNHLHLILSALHNNLSDVLGDFKTYTSKQSIAAIEDNPGESRRNWMLRIFSEQGHKNSRNSKYQFWRQDNQPKECFSPAFTAQKIDYIHNNPVAAGIVDKPEHYLYSSARDYVTQTKCSLLEVTFL